MDDSQNSSGNSQQQKKKKPIQRMRFPFACNSKKFRPMCMISGRKMVAWQLEKRVKKKYSKEAQENFGK